MKLKTRDFGEVEISQEDVVTFSSPLYGFEGLSQYVFLFEEENRHIVWLQSIENPDICFVMMDPAVIDSTYQPKLSREMKELLGEGNYLYWLIVVVAPEFMHSTVNMKSPVVVNIDRGRAVQAILEQNYPIRRSLGKKGEGDDRC